MSKLTAKQQAFVAEYLIDLNATQAAIRAGYSKKTAAQVGAENLRKPYLAEAIAKASKKREERTGITQDYVLQTIFDTVERCRQAKRVTDKQGKQVYVETEDGELVPAYVFDPKAVLRGAELLGKHLGMFAEKRDVTIRDERDLEQLSDEELAGLAGESEAATPVH